MLRPLLRLFGDAVRAHDDATARTRERSLRRRLLVAQKDALVDAAPRGLGDRHRIDERLRERDDGLLALDDEP